MTDDTSEKHCAFCFELVSVGDGTGLTLRVERKPLIDWQDFYAHPECLRSRLHPRVPLSDVIPPRTEPE